MANVLAVTDAALLVPLAVVFEIAVADVVVLVSVAVVFVIAVAAVVVVQEHAEAAAVVAEVSAIFASPELSND